MRNLKEYKKQRFAKEMLIKIMKKSDIHIPYGFNSSNQDSFTKYYIKSLDHIKQRNINYILSKLLEMNTNDFVSKYGNTPLTYNEKTFYYSAPMKSFFKKNMPFLVESNGLMSLEYATVDFMLGRTRDKEYWGHFWKKYEDFNLKKIKEIVSSDDINDEDSKLLNNYVKAVIVPPFVLFVSSLFIILNFLNLFWLVCHKLPLLRKKAITVVLIVIVFVVPLLISNQYSKYYEALDQEGNYLIYLSTKWVQNTSFVFHKMGIFNGVVNYLIDSAEVEFRFMESTTESRILIKRKRELLNF